MNVMQFQIMIESIGYKEILKLHGNSIENSLSLLVSQDKHFALQFLELGEDSILNGSAEKMTQLATPFLECSHKQQNIQRTLHVKEMLTNGLTEKGDLSSANGEEIDVKSSEECLWPDVGTGSASFPVSFRVCGRFYAGVLLRHGFVEIFSSKNSQFLLERQTPKDVKWNNQCLVGCEPVIVQGGRAFFRVAQQGIGQYGKKGASNGSILDPLLRMCLNARKEDHWQDIESMQLWEKGDTSEMRFVACEVTCLSFDHLMVLQDTCRREEMGSSMMSQRTRISFHGSWKDLSTGNFLGHLARISEALGGVDVVVEVIENVSNSWCMEVSTHMAHLSCKLLMLPHVLLVAPVEEKMRQTHSWSESNFTLFPSEKPLVSVFFEISLPFRLCSDLRIMTACSRAKFLSKDEKDPQCDSIVLRTSSFADSKVSILEASVKVLSMVKGRSCVDLVSCMSMTLGVPSFECLAAVVLAGGRVENAVRLLMENSESLLGKMLALEEIILDQDVSLSCDDEIFRHVVWLIRWNNIIGCGLLLRDGFVLLLEAVMESGLECEVRCTNSKQRFSKVKFQNCKCKDGVFICRLEDHLSVKNVKIHDIFLREIQDFHVGYPIPIMHVLPNPSDEDLLNLELLAVWEEATQTSHDGGKAYVETVLQYLSFQEKERMMNLLMLERRFRPMVLFSRTVSLSLPKQDLRTLEDLYQVLFQLQLCMWCVSELGVKTKPSFVVVSKIAVTNSWHLTLQLPAAFGGWVVLPSLRTFSTSIPRFSVAECRIVMTASFS
jgi:hypothetical protein